MTRAAEVRAEVAELDAQGLTAADIADKVGVPQARVERVLADLDGPPWDDREDAPVLEPLGRFAPDPAPASPPFGQGGGRRPYTDVAVLARPKVAVCGTPSGYQRHVRAKEPTCARCRAAEAQSRRDRTARRRAEGEAS
ncbi:TrmB family transcriptional regulator [Nakamurella flava]|uniref:TrmB family transcriptional regulator n=1 Tax=Nakamurella flava TaxID=2576308 RepID=A0A4U6QP51_9ACTN|nr:TrmB family transcriptional regulator [Nakamurella flava]TKV61846.1 TrmB family transcriptional regulator [Nakamurella flava]